MKKQTVLLIFAVLCLLSAPLFAGGQQEQQTQPAANQQQDTQTEQTPAQTQEPQQTKPPQGDVRLKLATTTSTENSGLLAVLLPPFTKDTGIIVDVIAVGTGKALALGRNGDVDVLMVHARAQEDQFVAEGYGVNRRDLMHNDFVILGPPADPAGIKGVSSAADALAKIAREQQTFISRGDNSGTNIKEKAIWTAAGITPKGNWYKEVGQGMGAVITMTNDMQGYTLADRGTYLSMKDKIGLRVLVEGDPVLFNPYGVIAVNPAKYPDVKYDAAMRFITFLTSAEGQSIIKNYQRNGEQLFYPDAIKDVK